jgi:hypothetical protein
LHNGKTDESTTDVPADLFEGMVEGALKNFDTIEGHLYFYVPEFRLSR